MNGRTAHILVVDDDREIRKLVDEYLVQHGYRVSQARDGRAMRQMLAVTSIDLIVLDVMLPGEDGLTLCRQLRADTAIPVIMLTALAGDTDRIIGLEIGADDYLVKPFNPRELVARIKAVLRRVEALPPRAVAQAPRIVRFEGWTLDIIRRELRAPGQVLIPLSTGEFDLLRVFVEFPGAVLSREQLLDLARGRGASLFDRSIDVQVSRLRRKLEIDPAQPMLIRTVRNGGYVLSARVETEPAD